MTLNLGEEHKFRGSEKKVRGTVYGSKTKAANWLRQLDAGLLPRRQGFFAHKCKVLNFCVVS
jgi:hypothetical protein